MIEACWLSEEEERAYLSSICGPPYEFDQSTLATNGFKPTDGGPQDSISKEDRLRRFPQEIGEGE